jgi:tetratricopeptide (TPR) repeat protein
MIKHLWRGAALVAALAGSTGCSSNVRDFVVAQRNHQGDLALTRGNLDAARVGYKLALQLSPSDEHARHGLVDVLSKLAEQSYEHSDFEGAIAALLQAQEIDPHSVRVSELREQVSQARIKRQIVQSNYPNYAATGTLITKAYQEIPALNKDVVRSLHKFAYSYDSQNLTEAIKNSYGLQEEVTRLTNRLIAYRQEVEAGTAARAGVTAPSSSGSLLPLP